MLSQSTTSNQNFALPKHFNFSALANQKKLTSETSPNPNTSPISNSNQNQNKSYEIPNNITNPTNPVILSSNNNSSNNFRNGNDNYSERSIRDHYHDRDRDHESLKSNGSKSKSKSNYYSNSSSSDDYEDDSDYYSRSRSKPKSYRHDSRHDSRSERSDRSARSEHSRRSDHSDHSKKFDDKYDLRMKDIKSIPLTEEEYRMKQIDLIISLEQFKLDGIPVDESVRLDHSTSLEKLQYAYDYSMRYVTRRAVFERFQQGLTLSTHLLELGNKFLKSKTGKGAELDGWSGSVMMNMPKFNRPLQRLADKYGVPGAEQSPEIELAMMLGYSAFSFHFAKKMSIDPQVAMQFMDYMQQKSETEESPPKLNSPAPQTTFTGNGNGRSLNHFERANMQKNIRPPYPQPRENDGYDSESFVSERTEEFTV